ncbi:MAG TPA: glycine cleavage system aminomethyltransferase GcvT [Thermodesulfobacteriota bacterium]|nr:glycine cleavage system aminomethyltransferase GcvT [Thermodesulfobacteriota bacterium]
MSRTALYDIHKNLGAKIVEFAGWEMPVQYEGIREEHRAVRSSAGLFDVSHMGEIFVTGPGAKAFTQWLTTNDVEAVKEFQAQYTLLCNREGGVVDDVIIYKFSEGEFLFCVNASNTAKDYEWIKSESAGFDVKVDDRSREYSQIAIQGPRSGEILGKLLGDGLPEVGRFRFGLFEWKGAEMIVARTGYTGEDGYEIFLPWDDGPALWESLMEAGRDYGIKPCGLGARDTLRIEMAYPLYGHEIDEHTNPLEAGLGRYIKLESGDFIGRDVLRKSLDEGLTRRLVGFEMVERGIPRQGYEIYNDGHVLGSVTSGTLSPSLDKSIGMGYLKSEAAGRRRVRIEIRGTAREAEVVDFPFYKKEAN